MIKLNTIAFLTLFLCGQASAECYLGVALQYSHLWDINTKTDYKLLEKSYLGGDIRVKGEVRKKLNSDSHELRLGCDLSDSWSVEAGYIDGMRLGSTTTASLIVFNHQLPPYPLTFRRDAHGSAESVSVLWYEGDPLDLWRGFIRLRYIRAHAEGMGYLSYPGQVDGKKGEFIAGVRLTRTKSALAPNLGVRIRLKKDLNLTTEVGYYGPKFQAVSMGLNFMF